MTTPTGIKRINVKSNIVMKESQSPSEKVKKAIENILVSKEKPIYAFYVATSEMEKHKDV
jgi:hypothetical protein